MFERRFGAFALGFESGGAFARNIVKFDDAVFNQAIEAFQTFIRINSFTLERQESAVDSLALRRLPLGKGSK